MKGHWVFIVINLLMGNKAKETSFKLYKADY